MLIYYNLFIVANKYFKNTFKLTIMSLNQNEVVCV